MGTMGNRQTPPQIGHQSGTSRPRSGAKQGNYGPHSGKLGRTLGQTGPIMGITAKSREQTRHIGDHGARCGETCDKPRQIGTTRGHIQRHGATHGESSAQDGRTFRDTHAPPQGHKSQGHNWGPANPRQPPSPTPEPPLMRAQTKGKQRGPHRGPQ